MAALRDASATTTYTTTIWRGRPVTVADFQGTALEAWRLVTLACGRFPIEFNDDPMTSREDMVLALKKAIELSQIRPTSSGESDEARSHSRY